MHVSLYEITKEMKRFDVTKACQDTNIATKVVKDSSDILADFLFLKLSNCIVLSVFPSNLENAEITPVHKKDSKNTKSIYRSVSILLNVSKMYQKCDFFPNLKLLRKDIAKKSIWFSKRIQYTTMFVGHDRKMASEFR